MKKAVAIVLSALFVLSFAACGSAGGITAWANSLSAEDISAAHIWNAEGGNHRETELSPEEIDEIVNIINSLKKNNFKWNKRLAGSTPICGLILMLEDEQYYIAESGYGKYKLEISYNDKQWWIDCEQLNDIIQNYY